MEKKEISDNSINEDEDNKLSDDPLIKQIDYNTFEIRITIELRKNGIYKIRITKERKFTIDTYEDAILSIANYEDTFELFNRMEDQLANDDSYMSSQFLDELWNFLNKSKTSIDKIIKFFQNQEIKGSSV